jgi:hypothetical protein
MKGIYLTPEGKQEIEAKIAEIESYEGLESGMADTLKEILSSATILPVEESWGDVPMGVNECELILPSGVIIQPKQ